MKHYHKNPRWISSKKFEHLTDTLARLGDLSGIVHDLNSDEIIGGNQRMRVFDLTESDVEIVERFDQPDEQGTVALGYVIWQGKRYSYRQVRWDERTAEEANIVANKAGGDWDFDILANEFDVEDLLRYGFEEHELAGAAAALAEGVDDDEESEAADDSLLQLTEVTIDEPRHKVERGEVWAVGRHILVCAEVIDEWKMWKHFLEDGFLFVPYAGPYAPLTVKADNFRFLMVQPDTYIAGHILDRYEEIHGEKSIHAG